MQRWESNEAGARPSARRPGASRSALAASGAWLPCLWIAIALVALPLAASSAAGGTSAAPEGVALAPLPTSERPPIPMRIVSLNPSLSAILGALGATDSLVGVDDASARAFPELAALPRVGGLFNPSLEGVVALRPDWVVLVPSVEQRDFSARLEALGVRVEAFPNDSLAAVVATIEGIGQRLGPQARALASARVAAIRKTRRVVAAVAERYEAPRSLIVLQRDPLYVVGRRSFLDEMLAAVGGRNAARAFDESYPRVGIEWLVEAAPELILDSSFDAELGTAFWERWPSIPAVAAGRVVSLRDPVFTLPGPKLDEALLLLLRTVHGEDAERAALEQIAAPSALEAVAQRQPPAP